MSTVTTGSGSAAADTRVAATKRGLRFTWRRAAIAVLVAFALVAPFAVYPMLAMKVLCFALFALSFNLLVGYVGPLSFGHAAFFGGAAYVSAHAMKVWAWPAELAIPFAAASAAAFGIVVGGLAIKRSGIYFSMITLAMAQLLFFVLLKAPFSGGEDGLQGVPRGRLFGLISLADNVTLYYVVLALFALGLFVVWRVVHSPFGQMLKAVRDNEPRAVSLGYDVQRIKLSGFVISAAIAGLAGATKALVFQLASLTDVHWHMSGEVVLMTLLGGMGTMLGPVVGAALIVSLQEGLADTGLPVTVVLGLMFIGCVLVFRRGIVGEVLARFPQLGR